MNWSKPAAGTDSWRWYITSESGHVICKAHCGARVVYTLSHRGVLVRSSEFLEELKELADESIGRL